MNKVSSNWIKTIFLYGVIGFMGYMTYTAVMMALGNRVVALLSIFLFDGGAYSGYQMYVGNAEGAHQRHAARVILWIDFLLAGFMVAGGLTLLPSHTILYVMLTSAVFNGGVLYYYETHKPETMAQMQEQDEQDLMAEAAAKSRKKLHKEAMRQANVNISKQAIRLGNLMSLRATAQLKYDMRLPMTEQELKAFREDAIDAEVAELPAPDGMPQQFGFWEYLKTFFTRKLHTTLQGMLSQPEEPSPSSTSGTGNPPPSIQP
jgi:hypothetical protein